MKNQILPFYTTDVGTDDVDESIIYNFLPFHQLILCVSGSGLCQSEYGVETHVRAGDILYTYTGTISAFCVEHAPLRLKKIAFDGSAIPGLLSYFGFGRSQFLPDNAEDSIALFHKIYEQFPSSQDPDEGALNLYRLLVRLGCDFRTASSRPDAGSAVVAHVRQYAEQNIHLPELPVEPLCRSLGIDDSELDQILLRHTKKNLRELILEIRMERIKNYLIMYPSYDLHFISELCGLDASNDETLRDCFTDYYGMTPAQYRRLFWKVI